MKKMVAILAAMLVGVAWAATSSSYSTTAAVNAAPPSGCSTTVGIPFEDIRTGDPLKSVVLTVSDYNDGGDDEDFALGFSATAWRQHPPSRMPDGGGCWLRVPQMDVLYTADAGAGFGTLGSTANSRGFSVTIPGPGFVGMPTALATFPSLGSGGRLLYRVNTFPNIDGGTPATTGGALQRMTIEGRY